MLFRSRRPGIGGQPFDCLKFRTMHTDAEQRQEELEGLNEASGALFKIRRDPRVTPVGGFLRRFSLDELPQLVNVLRGEMSLVGPRPLPMRDYDRLEEWHRKRYLVLPGITGLWQVSGRAELDFDELVRLDFLYLERWSVFLDLSILLKTMPAVLARRQGPSRYVGRLERSRRNLARRCQRSRPIRRAGRRLRARDAAARRGPRRLACWTSAAATGARGRLAAAGRAGHGRRSRLERRSSARGRRIRSSSWSLPAGTAGCRSTTRASTRSPAYQRAPARGRHADVAVRGAARAGPGGRLAVAVPLHGRVKNVADRAAVVRAPPRPARAGAALLHPPLAAAGCWRTSASSRSGRAGGRSAAVRETLLALGPRAAHRAAALGDGRAG